MQIKVAIQTKASERERRANRMKSRNWTKIPNSETKIIADKTAWKKNLDESQSWKHVSYREKIWVAEGKGVIVLGKSCVRSFVNGPQIVVPKNSNDKFI